MKDGYPTKKDLDFIKNCESEKFIELLNFIDNIYTYDKPKKEWIKHRGSNKLLIKISTWGWSGNESIIEAL